MLIDEIVTEEIDVLEKAAWGKKGTKLVRKFRCASGPKKGRLVSKQSQCSAAKNMKKSQTMKKTRKAKKSSMARKSRKTKRVSAGSKRANKMNKSRKKK